MVINEDMSLREAKDWLRERALAEGARCPCCEQMAKVYRRTINAGMARSLAKMYRHAKTDWVHVPTVVGSRSREEGKLAYWGLVEEEVERRPDGGRAGWWRVTSKGEAFLLGQLTVPKYAHVYNGRCLGFTGSPVSIEFVTAQNFDLREVMGA